MSLGAIFGCTRVFVQNGDIYCTPESDALSFSLSKAGLYVGKIHQFWTIPLNMLGES